MTTLEVLTRARELIDSPEKWCRGHMEIRLGSTVMSRCLVAALGAASMELRVGAAQDAYDAVARELPGDVADSLEDFNDDALTSHADIMALLDRAIERERERG